MTALTYGQTAKRDLQYCKDLDFVSMDFSAMPCSACVEDFVSKLPERDRKALLDDNGLPVQEAFSRLSDALLYEAFEDEELVNLCAYPYYKEEIPAISFVRSLAPYLPRYRGTLADVSKTLCQAAVLTLKKYRNAVLCRRQRTAPVEETADSKALEELSVVLEGNVLNSIRAARYARIELDQLLEQIEQFDQEVKADPAAIASFWKENFASLLDKAFFKTKPYLRGKDEDEAAALA